ncbi:OLC1v1015094C1 [Oldenlandia corymbosa var. corymbosa]|uniref:OLC1v1015094C1 n=1 Tax=Oldenlandia corymbosa var. corymbosa TaxID=529605 RepID=A0AAV1E638_OLDCO|nr:OLC1v1015094C1 [Oldenlandia corymbosa var. corymbosa]
MSKSKNKKRREVQEHHEQEESEKKKKNIEEEVITDVKIELRDENPDKVDPVIGYFPSGYDPSGGGEGTEEPNVTFYKHPKRVNRMKLVVDPNGENSRVNFVGTSFSGEAMAPQVCTYRLGILDKATQTLKIVPIAANKIFRLEPRVEGFDQPEDEIDNERREETAEERNAMKDKLTKTYSTKKSMREARKLERLREKPDENTKNDLTKQLDGVKINESALKDPDTNKDARNIPPYDLEATTPEAAYPLNKIIFEGEWEYLLDVLELSNTGAEVSGDVYPTFVRNRVYKLGDIKDLTFERKSVHLICCSWMS